MAWIKRNLALVISGVIALGLLGFGGYYLWAAMQKNAQIDNDIGQAKSDLDLLMNLDPFPSPSNVNQARAELARLNTFIGVTKKLFPSTPPPAAPLNTLTFKSLLQTTVAELNRQAEAAGVRVETNYYFSFEAQRLPVTFPAETLLPLSERLHEIAVISSNLFKAKINRLERIRRSPVPGELLANDARHAAEYLNESVRVSPESGMQLWPYEFVFHCFSPELATVMEQLMRMPDATIVKSVVVQPAEHLPDVQRGVPPPPPAARTNRPLALETILNERALRVVMKIEVVKPAK